MRDAIAGVRGVVVRHLEALYPGGRIDATAEQAARLPATRIVFQFPFNWYSTSPMLKAWQDEVLTVGFAYGSGGTRMRGKRLQLVLYHVPSVPDIPVPADVDARSHTFALQYRDLLATPEAAIAAMPR
jgi:Flavodoxin-like fold